MQQRWLLNLGLFGIIVILGGLVFYTLQQEKQKRLPPLTTLETAQIQHISINQEDGESIELEKNEQGEWYLTTPLELPANGFRVERLLELLSERDYKPLETSQLKLADLKLEPPLASVKFDQLEVAFGDRSPMNDGQRYIQINQKVYLLTDTLFYSVNGDITSFVSLALLGEIAKITELKLPDYHFVWKDQQWSLTSTLSADEVDMSQKALDVLIDNWQNVQAFNVESYVEAPASGQIEVTLEGQSQPLHFTIISTTPQFVLARPDKGVQYQIPINQVEKLLHLPTKVESEESNNVATPDEKQPSEPIEE